MPPERSRTTSASARGSRATPYTPPDATLERIVENYYDRHMARGLQARGDEPEAHRELARLRALIRRAAEIQYMHNAQTATDKDVEEHVLTKVPALHEKSLRLLARATGRGDKSYNSEEQLLDEVEQDQQYTKVPALYEKSLRLLARATGRGEKVYTQEQLLNEVEQDQQECYEMNKICPPDPITLESRDWCQVPDIYRVGPDEKRCFHILEMAQYLENGLLYVNVHDRKMFGEDICGNTKRHYYETYKSGSHLPKVPLKDYWNRTFTTDQIIEIGAHLASIDALKDFPMLAAVVAQMSEGKLHNTHEKDEHFKEDQKDLTTFVRDTAKKLKLQAAKGVFEADGCRVYISEEDRRRLEMQDERRSFDRHEGRSEMQGGSLRRRTQESRKRSTPKNRGSRKHVSKKRVSRKHASRKHVSRKRVSRKHVSKR